MTGKEHRLKPVPLFTESATENKPPVEWSTVASRRETCKTPAKADSAVRVKRWGKSPPLVWRQTRHGKPRVVQGQIGGESRPGSLSAFSRESTLLLRWRKPSWMRTLG